MTIPFIRPVQTTALQCRALKAACQIAESGLVGPQIAPTSDCRSNSSADGRQAVNGTAIIQSVLTIRSTDYANPWEGM